MSSESSKKPWPWQCTVLGLSTGSCAFFFSLCFLVYKICLFKIARNISYSLNYLAQNWHSISYFSLIVIYCIAFGRRLESKKKNSSFINIKPKLNLKCKPNFFQASVNTSNSVFTAESWVEEVLTAGFKITHS
jgi:hypothetical protein